MLEVRLGAVLRGKALQEFIATFCNIIDAKWSYAFTASKCKDRVYTCEALYDGNGMQGQVFLVLARCGAARWPVLVLY